MLNIRAFGKLRRIFFLLPLSVILILALKVTFWRPFRLVGDPPKDGFFRVAGAIHVHSVYSDGTGTPEEIIRDAQSAGLSFLIITDHKNLDAKNREGYHKNLLVLVGSELSTHSGHILGIGIPDPQFRFSSDAEDVLKDIRDLGGTAFVAHPFSVDPEFSWSGWKLPGSWGMEIINEDSQARAAGRWGILKAGMSYGLNPGYALLSLHRSPISTLAKWDQMLQQRDVSGIIGSDAHRRLEVKKHLVLRLPSYKAIFSTAQNHVMLEAPLTHDPAQDGKAILQALRRGNSYIGIDGLAPSNGFYFYATDFHKRWCPGETVPAGRSITLFAGGQLPAESELRLLRDGRLMTESKFALREKISLTGVYRIEVYLPGWDIPWIISNPIYLFDSQTSAERSARAAWPPEAQPPEPVTLLDSFRKTTIFTTHADIKSTVNSAVIDTTMNAGCLQFHLGRPSALHPFVWCELSDMQKRDLSAYRGLEFSMKADGTYRLWTQVWDENPAANQQGNEWWLTSVKTGTNWQKISVPFSILRSANKHTDGKLDLDKVKAIVFILDQRSDKPGTSGTIWIRDLYLY